MSRPLPQEISVEKLPPGGNAGLWYDKYCDTWLQESRRPSERTLWTLAAQGRRNPKMDWIKKVVGPVGERELVREACHRRISLVQAAQGWFGVFRTAQTFVTGLGRSHPVENGFSWHPTLGTPYLPGSSIKGLVRSWLREEREDVGPERLVRIFGDRNQAGKVAFLDAIPLSPPQVVAEVITPHYANWTPDALPGDWRSPVPIPFLATDAGARLLFSLIPLPGLGPGDLEAAAEWLGEALAEMGAGAKTAVGFGRMEADDEQQRQLLETIAEQRRAAREEAERNQRLAMLGPLVRELENLAAGSTQGDLPDWQRWLKALLEAPWDDEKKRQAAAIIQGEMERLGKWRPVSNKKKPEKDKDYLRTQEVLRLLGRSE